MQFEPTRAFAAALDQEDPLRDFRNQFILPSRGGQELVYFLGNSLGLQPRLTRAYLDEILDQWASHGVEAFFTGSRPWIAYHDALLPPLARIVGCRPDELVVMNQLSVNLHLMLASFYQPAGKRTRILCEAKAFPSDQYVLETHVRHHGLDPATTILELAPAPGESTLSTAAIQAAIDRHREELALVLLGGVNYYTGQVFDLAAITEAAHRAGALAGFDLAHAAGNVPLRLHDWDVDFACWCHYKYLNAGPGAIGGVFIHARHHGPQTPRLAGWWGYQRATRFRMEKGFVPDPGAAGWQLSTPSPLLYASLRASLDLFDQAGWARILDKASRLNDYLWYRLDLLNDTLRQQGVRLLTPREPQARGCQVSLLLPGEGRGVYDALTERGFFVDWREPNVVRLAPVALYNQFGEVWAFTEALQDILSSV